MFFCFKSLNLVFGGGGAAMKIALLCLAIILQSFLFLGQENACAEEMPSDITELSIEELMKIEVVYAASKFEQKVTEAPSSVSIITADDIRKHGYRTLADILQSARGFYISYDRHYKYVGVRGFARPGDYNTRVLILVDGHRINDNVYGQGYIGTDFILDIDLIDRVELIRGPSSSLYGSNAFFGVINIITKNGKAINGLESSGEAGSFNTYKGRISFGKRFENGLDLLLSSTTYDSEGHALYFNEFNSTARNDDDSFKSVFSSTSFYGFTLQAAYSEREKGIPTGAWETVFDDPSTRTIDKSGYIHLSYSRDFDYAELMARLYYDYNSYDGNYRFPGVLNKDLSRGKWWGGEMRFTVNKIKRNRLIVGGEYVNNILQEQVNYDEDPYSLKLEDRRDSQDYAFYAQDEITILNNLLLNIGARYDHYDTFGSTTNPRIALIYNPVKDTTVKLLYGSAFRAPNVYELYYHDGLSTQKPAQSLRPETIKTYELTIEQYIKKNTLITVSGYYYKIKDLITLITDTDGLMVYRNMYKVEAKGMEIGLEQRWQSGIRGKGSYSYQEVRDEETDYILTNSPRHLAKLNIIFPLIKNKLFSAVETQYTGKRKTLTGNETEDFFTANLTLSAEGFLKGLDASFGIYNIFDEKYRDPASQEHAPSLDTIEQDGRSLRLKLTYRF